MTTMDVTARCAEHPAASAWRMLHPEGRSPASISVLKTEEYHSAVYRLERAGPSGGAVIAKRCKPAAAEVEKAIYEQILPRIPVSAPRFFGTQADPAGKHAWLFVEDVGEERYSDSDLRHRTMASKWLGLMHVSAAQVAARLPLPDRRPLYYLGLLRTANANILKILPSPELRRHQREVLAALVRGLRSVELRWENLHEFCSVLLPTLVHCDFVAKNLRVRHVGTKRELLPFDWECSGYGLPAPDLEGVEIDAYLSVVRTHWTTLTEAKLRRAAAAGRLFRIINFIYWASLSLESSWEQKIIDNRMTFYLAWLYECLREFGWT